LTDAPGPFERVDVTIDAIEAHRSGDAPDVYVEIARGPVRVDLLSLQAGKEMRLGAASVTPGAYDGFRVRVSAPSVTLAGVAMPLPLEVATVDVEYPFEVARFDDRRMLLDFDARASIRELEGGALSFRPSILVKREQAR
jgi:hypothetical protein